MLTSLDARTSAELGLLAAACGVMLLIAIVLARRAHRASIRRARAQEGRRPAGKPVSSAVQAEDTLHRQLAEISRRLAALETGMGQIVNAIPHTVQGVGVVRYNPFPEMGGNMSFSLALLDGRANGVVISVLNDRNGSRVYGKAVESGVSTYTLSDEEQQALALARENR